MPDLLLLRRLRERKLVQWALAYLAGAFVVFQAVEVMAEPWSISAGFQRSVHVLLLFGLLVTLVLAWYHGEKGQQRVSGPELLWVFALLILTGGALSMVRASGPLSAPAASARITDPRPSLAALPFANLSAEADDAYLADGIHDEILVHLAKIGGLRVVSRTSVMEYREAEKNLTTIASELGVGAILEGSVQRVGDRIRVSAQLIDAGLDEHLWGETFDEELSLESLFGMQVEIAQRIAAALRAELTPAETARIEARPTQHLGAYQAYLRGRHFLHLPHFTIENLTRALQEFERAVALDSTFALAHAELANGHSQQVFYWADASEERRERAAAAAQRAVRLDPSSARVRLVLGLQHLWLDRDPDRALAEIARAEEGLPNDPGVFEARAAVYELQGRFREAVDEYRRVLDLSPRDASIYTMLIQDQWVLREYDRAQAAADRAMELAPDQMWPSLLKVYSMWSEAGATAETRAILEALPMGGGWILWSWYWQAVLEDRYDEALLLLDEAEDEWIRVKMWARPLTLYRALTLRAMGQHERAAGLFQEAVVALEQEVEAFPDDPRYHSSLGLAYAGLRMAEEAVREGEQAVALLPVSEDAFYGLPYLVDLASIHTMVGDDTAALAGIEHLLSIPSWFSPAWLEVDFRFDALRDHDRFRALMQADEGAGA
jgi:serine/threonine-protein kinase